MAGMIQSWKRLVEELLGDFMRAWVYAERAKREELKAAKNYKEAERENRGWMREELYRMKTRTYNEAGQVDYIWGLLDLVAEEDPEFYEEITEEWEPSPWQMKTYDGTPILF